MDSESNQKNEVTWERWAKKRTFVRALEGTYGELMEELFSQPRIYPTQVLKWKGGPQNFGKKVINPQAVKVTQSIEAHVDAFAPGGHGQTENAVSRVKRLCDTRQESRYEAVPEPVGHHDNHTEQGRRGGRTGEPFVP